MDGDLNPRSRREPAFRWVGLILGAALVAAPAVASAASLDLFYERTVMSAANGRCGLFTAQVGSALEAARVQARGAALRAGAGRATLSATEQRARSRAATVACDAPDLKLAADRVRQAFDGYARLIRMDYPGDQAVWRADRSSSAMAARWRLAQDVRADGQRMVFGLAGREGSNALIAVASFSDGDTPYAARLIMRDARVTQGPFLDARGEALARIPLPRRLSPNGAQTVFAAQARNPAGVDLKPKDMAQGWAFRFPPEAAWTLAALDPREAVAVEFLFPDDTTRRIYVEVGDFAAGRAFLQLASR
jgi:hypothetical protein